MSVIDKPGKRPATASRTRQGPSEKQFMQAVIDYARLCGWLVFHPFDSRRSAAGWPDLVLVRGRSLVFAELKVRGNVPTLAQREWLAALDLAGQETYVWYPDSWEAIEVVLGTPELPARSRDEATAPGEMPALERRRD